MRTTEDILIGINKLNLTNTTLKNISRICKTGILKLVVRISFLINGKRQRSTHIV